MTREARSGLRPTRRDVTVFADLGVNLPNKAEAELQTRLQRRNTVRAGRALEVQTTSEKERGVARGVSLVSRAALELCYLLEGRVRRLVSWTRRREAIQRRLRDAQEGLNLFRSLAKDNGIDPETLYQLGGEPSFSDCEQSAKEFNS